MKHILLYYLFLSCIKPLGAQCFSTSFNNGSSFSTDNSSGGTYDFSIPTNSQVSDNSRATASSLVGIFSADTYYLKVTGFNFSIPSYASICGITVEVENRAMGLLLTAAIRDNEVRLIKNGVIRTDTNAAKGGDWGSADGYRSYGGTNNLWGTTLTPADVNASNFGVAFSASIIALIAALPSAQIDHIRMKVDYNPILPVLLQYFKASLKNKRVALEWKTTEEENDASISLQRSFNNNEWQGIARYKLGIQNNNKVYQYEDMPLQNGKYAYRLKISSASGLVTYSATRYISTEDQPALSLYPNPAADFIILNQLPGTEPVTISDIYGKQWPVTVERINAGSANLRISLQKLPNGLYFVQSNGQSTKFIKE